MEIKVKKLTMLKFNNVKAKPENNTMSSMHIVGAQQEANAYSDDFVKFTTVNLFVLKALDFRVIKSRRIL